MNGLEAVGAIALFIAGCVALLATWAFLDSAWRRTGRARKKLENKLRLAEKEARQLRDQRDRLLEQRSELEQQVDELQGLYEDAVAQNDMLLGRFLSDADDAHA